MQEFGISVSGKFERVEGRVLEPPPLKYASNNPVIKHDFSMLQHFKYFCR